MMNQKKSATANASPSHEQKKLFHVFRRVPETENALGRMVRRAVKTRKAATYSRRSTFTLLALIFFVSFYAGWMLRVVWNNVLEGKNELLQAQNFLINFNFRNADASFDRALSSVKEARANVSRVGFLKKLPWIGTQVHAAENLLDAGIIAGDSLDAVTGIVLGSPVVDEKRLNLWRLDQKAGEKTLGNIATLSLAIDDISHDLDGAIAKVESIPDEGPIDQLVAARDELSKKLSLLKDFLITAEPLLSVLPDISAYNERKTYLFLLLQPDELRPVGYISAYAVMEFENGRLVNFISDNSYNLDNDSGGSGEPPPAPLALYDGDHPKTWFFRDSGWSPDFQEAGRVARRLYEKEGGILASEIDGVFAITPDFVSDMIDLAGGEIDVRNQRVKSRDVYELIESEANSVFSETYDIPERERKYIIFQMGIALLDEMFRTPTSEWGKILDTIMKNLDEKHIVLFYDDARVQERVSERFWDGRLFETQGDYVAVVDANVGSANKSDLNMQRFLRYTVRVDNGEILAALEMRYVNKNEQKKKKFPDIVDDLYQTYTRFYVPDGSEFISSSGGVGAVEVTEELGKTVFGKRITVPLGEERIVRLEYRLPPRIAKQIQDGSYTVLLQKQIGSRGYFVQLNLFFPKNIKYAFPPEAPDKFGDNGYDAAMDLQKDIGVKISL